MDKSNLPKQIGVALAVAAIIPVAIGLGIKKQVECPKFQRGVRSAKKSAKSAVRATYEKLNRWLN